MQRREFVRQSALMSATAMLFPAKAFHLSRLIERIGVQFFSLPKLLEKDLEGTLKMLSNMGYKEVELYGPYPFSTDADKKAWQDLGPALGFNGSGFYGRTAAQMKDLLNANNLTAPSLHVNLGTLEDRMDQLGEAAQVVGAEFVTLPAIPQERRKTLDDYKKMADTFNKIGAAAKKAGVKFAYHNHGYGLQKMNGQIPIKIILDNTDPALVFLEMDLYWTTAGGADPVEYLKTYKGRYRLMHVKDMMKKVRFSGDGSDPKQWVELFPFMTTAGNGVVDLKTILPAARANGVRHFIVEQDIVADPEVALKKSYDYLASL